MVYTPSSIRTKVSPNNFGGLRNDGNRVAMTGALGNAFQTQDATASPVVSPVTVNTTTTLIVPINAVRFTLISTTNAVQISEDSTYSAVFTIPAATIYTIDCANMTNIYLKTASSTVINFNFATV